MIETQSITPDHLQKKAIVYVRQSTQAQVIDNLESQRRQYALKDNAREKGFTQIELIDDDLGRSGSGTVERPGFQRLVAEVLTSAVGAIFCIEASRLARNGRDWHQLIDLCSLVGTLIIDPDGVYDPRITNDRLLLGLKGTMSEFELNLIYQRSHEALRAKAARGELRLPLPPGFGYGPTHKIELDPDRRVQEAIRLVFKKFRELGSARQVMLWFRQQGVSIPIRKFNGGPDAPARWKLPDYVAIRGMLSNPVYAGAYTYGRTEHRTSIVDGRARKTYGHKKSQDRWTVLIRDHHPGYISWTEFERNRAISARNAFMKKSLEPKSGRGGRALLTGLLRCRRCGQMLSVSYSGRDHIVRYTCKRAQLTRGAPLCTSFGGLRVDLAVGKEIVKVVSGKAVQAALEAIERMSQRILDEKRAVSLELEQARYEAGLAARRYESVDPGNRLVASELEARWNVALDHSAKIEARLRDLEATQKPAQSADRASLFALAADLPQVWESPSTDARAKQRIVQILIREIIADVDVEASEVVLLIHWTGGRHSELRIPKNPTGRHRHCTSLDAVEIMRRMAGQWSHRDIRLTLNRLGLKSGTGLTWTTARVRDLCHRLGLPPYDPSRTDPSALTMTQAARRLGVSCQMIRTLIRKRILPARQAFPASPWIIDAAKLDTPEVRRAVREVKEVPRLGSRSVIENRETQILPGFQP